MILCLHVLLHVGVYAENSYVLHCWGISKIPRHIINAVVLLFSSLQRCMLLYEYCTGSSSVVGLISVIQFHDFGHFNLINPSHFKFILQNEHITM